MEQDRVLFVTREPLLHHTGGSTTYALNFLRWLVNNGCEVTVLSTLAASRSPRVLLQMRVASPEGVRLQVPGMLRCGSWYVQPFSLRAWVRALHRAASRVAWLRPLSRWLASRFRGVTDVAWDLTPPTAAEQALVLRAAKETGATTVIGNYAYWGEAFRAPELAALPRVLLMHDLLSARVAGFRNAGLALDCPPIEPAMEFAWLNGASCLLAAQAREAADIAPHVVATILVQPTVMEVVASDGFAAVEPGRLLLVGGNIAPNCDGLQWFLTQVWPLVLAQTGGAVLAIAGSLGEVVPHAAPQVAVLGVLPSLDAEYARAAVCVVPLRMGTGIKIKLLEALAHGKAVVSTAVGVDGLDAGVCSAVCVADDPASFAAAVCSLLGEDGERQKFERSALALAQQRFSSQQPMPPEFAAAVLGR
jgi:succinoglycan biosynthesis protein ExoO